MAKITLIEEETNLAGVLTSQIAATDGNGATFTATFFDTRTGTARTPQSTSLTFLLNKDSKKAERIRLSSHSTASGVTTCTIATNGRSLPMYGTGAGTTTGFQHNAGDPIGCVTNHEGVAQLNDFVDGTKGSGANNLRVGDETDSDITFYAQNADGNKPFLRYDKTTNAWVFSNDGSSSTAIGNGASVYTGGDGISVTASDIDVDLTDTTIFKSSSAGAGDSGKVPRLNGSGKLDLTFVTTGAGSDYITGASANVTGTNLSTLTAGSASNADSLHTHDIFGNETYYAQEAISQYDAVCLLPIEVEWFTQLTEAAISLGDSNTRRKYAVKFVPHSSRSFTTMGLRLRKVSSATQTITVSIQTDSSGAPSGTAVTNGTANTIAASGLGTSFATSTVTWASAPSLSDETTYWLVIEVDATDGTNYVEVGVNSSYDENYHTFTRLTYNLDTASWGGSVTNATPFFWTISTVYALGQAIAQCNATYGRRTWTFIGFAPSAISAQASGTVNTDTATLTGLTPNKDYYLSTSAGQISLTATTAEYQEGTAPTAFLYKIGRSRSTTKLKIKPGAKQAIIREATGITATTTRQYAIWFKPEFVQVDAIGGASTTGAHSTGYVLSDASDRTIFIESADTGAETANSSNSVSLFVDEEGASNGFSGAAATFTEAGFTYTFTEAGTGTVMAHMKAFAS